MTTKLLIPIYIEPKSSTIEENVQCISYDDVENEKNTEREYLKQQANCYNSKCHPSKPCYSTCNA